MLTAQVDLEDGGVLRIELPIGKVGAEHQQGIALLHGVVAGAESEQSSHADVEGIVVLDDLLAPEGMDDRRLNDVGQGEDLVMGPQQPDPARMVTRRAELSASAATSSSASLGESPAWSA